MRKGIRFTIKYISRPWSAAGAVSALGDGIAQLTFDEEPSITPERDQAVAEGISRTVITVLKLLEVALQVV